MRLLLWCLAACETILGAHVFALTNCPRNQVKFEKIIGLRPSDSVNAYLLAKARQNSDRESLVFECIAKCWSDENCASFALHYNISQCFWYNLHVAGFREREDAVIDPNVAWFEKTCLDVRGCDKLWIFDRVPGATLIGHDKFSLPNVTTRRECQQRCLDEKDNACRSAKFKIMDGMSSTDTLGICTLSYSDRHFSRSSYRASSYNEEYFENLCSNVTTRDFCSYEEYEDVALSHTDVLYLDKTQVQCEQICESLQEFQCRGYSLVPAQNDIILVQNGIDDKYAWCHIHSEDSKIHGPSSFESIKGARFYEKARCLNISVTCTNNEIFIEYRPEINFFGKLYMSGFSEHLECYVQGSGRKSIVLRMPLMGNRCGIEEAKSVNGINRTLLSGNMILQYNRLIQTQGDRLIKVGCIFSHENTVVLGTGVTVGSDSSFPTNKGTTIFNSTTVHPTVEMQILDFYSQKEISDTQIGQELQLIIEIKPPKGPYDIWAGHLVAMTEDGHDSILLLDDRGCPTNLNVFPGLVKIANNETNKLTANFQAFKFTSSPIVRFSVIVQFCPFVCTPPECEQFPTVKKRKRQIQKRMTFYNNSSVLEVNRNEFDEKGSNILKMPLEFILVVRNSKIVSDKLVYGENNKILVAGYDVQTNEICFDYSLMVGIIITWTLIQIIIIVCCFLIIRRYKLYYRQERTTQSLEELHKNFGLGFSNLEPRRVHFADNNDFT